MKVNKVDFSTISTRSRDNGNRLVSAYDAAAWGLRFKFGCSIVKSNPISDSEVINKQGQSIGKLLSVRQGGLSNGVYTPPIYTIALFDGKTLG